MEDSVSPYLVEVTKEPIAIEWTTKQAQASVMISGPAEPFLARVIELHQEEITMCCLLKKPAFLGCGGTGLAQN